MSDHLSKAEITKDVVQGTVEAGAHAAGEAARIVTGAVKDLAGVVGDLATEVFELRDSARKAAAEHGEE